MPSNSVSAEYHQVLSQIVAWEHYEWRPFGAPGETRRNILWVEHYRNKDGSIADDLAMLIQDRTINPNTIYIRPLYGIPQQLPEPLKG